MFELVMNGEVIASEWDLGNAMEHAMILEEIHREKITIVEKEDN